MTFPTDDKPRTEMPREMPAVYRAALDLWHGRSPYRAILDALATATPIPDDIANSGRH